MHGLNLVPGQDRVATVHLAVDPGHYSDKRSHADGNLALLEARFRETGLDKHFDLTESELHVGYASWSRGRVVPRLSAVPKDSKLTPARASEILRNAGFEARPF